jgi:cytochrome c oxidase subunit 4
MDDATRKKEHFQDAHVATLHPNYMGVFWWLLALTILELICGSLPTGPMYPYAAKVVLLVSMAFTKAALVGLYFMHLKFENRTLTLIAVTPMALCVFFLFMLMPDSSPLN